MSSASLAGRDVSPRAIRPSEDLDRGASPVKLRMMHLSNRLAGLQDELDAEKKVGRALTNGASSILSSV